MKLFLSSLRLPNKSEQVKLFGSKTQLRVTIIPNAWDPYPKDRRKVELADTSARFEALGYQSSVLDLVTSSDKQMHESLSSSDLVWVTGGNSFYLNYQLQHSGFDKLLKGYLTKGLVYGGASAGAIVASPTLHGVENADDPKDTPSIIWDGLSIVKFGIVPHWGMEKYADDLEKMADEMRPYVPQLVTLTNAQAVIVIDDKLEVV